MSLLLNDPDFYFTSILNEETLNSSIINLNGQNGVLKGVNNIITGNSTTDDLPEGTNLYFTNARAQGAFTGGSGIVISSGTISNTGVLSLTGTANRITVSGSTGNITLSGPQDIQTTSSPTFAGLTLGSLSGVLKATAGVISNGATTDDLTEGKTNLYFTNARAQGAFTPGTGISITAGNIAIGQVVATTSSPTFAGLTLTGLNGILKATAGVISNGATTDDLLEGKTNLYFTNARAQGAFTPGTGISIASGVITNTAPATITSITGTANQIIVTGTGAITLSTPQDIGTGSNVQFARLLNSSIGSTNILIGNDSGINMTTAGGNTLIGQSAGGGITTGTFNLAIGNSAMGGSGNMTESSAQNIAIGNSALFSCASTAKDNIAIGFSTLQTLNTGRGNVCMGNSTANSLTTGINNTCIGNFAGFLNQTGNYNTLIGMSTSYILNSGQFNTCLGYLAGQSLISGSNNLHLGYNTQASSSTVNNEIVIGNSTTITQGKGANTAFINAPSGLISYSPAYCQLRSTAFNNGIVTWEFWNDTTTTYNNGFTLLNVNRLVVQPFNGLYEVTVSGNAVAQASLFVAIDLNVNNVKFYNIAYQSSSGINGYIVNVSGSQLSRPYAPAGGGNTGWEVYCNGGKFYSLDFPLFMTIKFIGL